MKYYAGIGARKSPKHIQTIMCHLAGHLFMQGITLRTGGAEGADEAFEKGHDLMAEQLCRDEQKEIYLPWRNFNNHPSRLNPSELPFSREELAFTKEYHPHWDKCSPAAKKLHARNTRIILGHRALHGEMVLPVSFVICWTENGEAGGGTGQALRIAESLEIPIIDLGRARTTEDLDQMVMLAHKLSNGE